MSNEILNSSKKYFSHIPKDWSLKKLEELVYQKITYGIVQPGKFDETGIPLIRGVDYMSGWKDMKSFFKVSKELHTKFKRSTTKRGDVLLSIAGYAGHVSMVPNWVKEANITQTTARISISKDKALPDYVVHFLGSDDGKLQSHRYIKGSAQEGLNLDDVQNFLIPLPSFPEQNKIATILTSVDEVIEKTQRQIDKLQDLKKGMMKKLLTQGIGHTEFKDSELGKIPKNWMVLDFQKIIQSSNQGVNTTTEKVTYSTEGIIVCRSNNIKENSFDWSNKKFVNKNTYDRMTDKVKPKLNDVLYCNIGSNLGAATVVETPVDYLITWNVLRITTEKNKIYPHFLSHSLNSLRKELMNFATESTMPFISSKALSKFKFKIPPLNEQKKISEVIDGIVNSINILKLKKHQTQSLKKSLMQDLLTGKVRVKVN